MPRPQPRLHIAGHSKRAVAIAGKQQPNKGCKQVLRQPADFVGCVVKVQHTLMDIRRQEHAVVSMERHGLVALGRHQLGRVGSLAGVRGHGARLGGEAHGRVGHA